MFFAFLARSFDKLMVLSKVEAQTHHKSIIRYLLFFICFIYLFPSFFFHAFFHIFLALFTGTRYFLI